MQDEKHVKVVDESPNSRQTIKIVQTALESIRSTAPQLSRHHPAEMLRAVAMRGAALDQ